MGNPAHAIQEEDADELPIAPTVEAWRAMTQRERDAFIELAMAASVRQFELMAEGAPHARSKTAIYTMLADHYARSGRKIYLGCELTVYYPGERIFTPDLIAVADVEDPGDADTRMAWIVAEEGQGIDLALEVTHHGSRRKDLALNVLDYARLGVPEYFIYDRLKQRVIGYRLPTPSATRYEPIPLRGGLLRSNVLGLDMGILDDKIRFFANGSQIPETRELLARANLMLDAVERRADEESRRADEESRRADEESRRAEEESRRAEEALQRAESAESARAELEARLAALLAERGG